MPSDSKRKNVSLVISTLHSLCYKELKRDFPEKEIEVIDKALQRETFNSIGLIQHNRKYHSDVFVQDIPEQLVLEGAFRLQRGKSLPRIWAEGEHSDLYEKYVSEYISAKQNLNNNSSNRLFFDFNDILLQAREALVMGRWEDRRKYDLVFVDEVQDMTPFQLDIIRRLLSPEKGRICYFGDPQQAIYSFMGANVKSLFTLWKTCGNHSFKRINYRSSETIIHFLNQFARDRIHLNPQWDKFCKQWQQLPSKHSKELSGQVLEQIHTANFHEEMKAITAIIDSFPNSESTAVLARSNLLVDKAITYLKSQKKYCIIDSDDSVHTYSLRFLTAHLRLCYYSYLLRVEDKGNLEKIQKEDVNSAWRKALPFIIGGEGHVAYGFFDWLKDNGLSLHDLMMGKDLVWDGYGAIKSRLGFTMMHRVLMNRYRPLFERTTKRLEQLAEMPSKSINNALLDMCSAAYAGLVKASFLPPLDKRLWYSTKELIRKELSHGNGNYQSQFQLLLKRMTEWGDEKAEGYIQATDFRKIVHVMTIHKAKGKGFDNVCLIGSSQYNENYRSAASDEDNRIFFVGLSRARKRILLSFSDQMAQNGHRSKKAKPFYPITQ